MGEMDDIHLDPQALDDAIAAASFTGVATVDVGDQRLLERCEGYLHRAHRVPMTADARIAIASGNKTFTALAVMRLVEDGRLRLDQPVRTLLGEDLHLIDDAVTVEQLLTHTSGIGDYLDEDHWDPANYVLTVPGHTLTTAQAFLPMLDGHPQKFTPGARFSYCNGGFMVLAILIERAPAAPTMMPFTASCSSPPASNAPGSSPSTTCPPTPRAATSDRRATS